MSHTMLIGAVELNLEGNYAAPARYNKDGVFKVAIELVIILKV